MPALKEKSANTRLAMVETHLKNDRSLVTFPTRTFHPEGQTFAKLSYIIVGMKDSTYDPGIISMAVKKVATAFRPLSADPAFIEDQRLVIGVITLEEDMDGVAGMFHEAAAQPRGHISIFFYPSEAEARFAYALNTMPEEPAYARLPVDARR